MKAELYVEFKEYSMLLSSIEEQREELKQLVKSFFDQLDLKMLTTQSLHNLTMNLCYEQLEDYLNNPVISREVYLTILDYDTDFLEEYIINKGIERCEVSSQALLDFWKENIIFKHKEDIPNCQSKFFEILRDLIELEQKEVELTPMMTKKGYYSCSFI